MTLQECYAALGGDYEEVLSRLRSENLVRKFLLKFPADPSYDLLTSSLAGSDWPEAFRGAHTIKGVCQNLSFTTLYRSSAQLCDALREGRPPQDPGLVRQVIQDYETTVSAIRAYEAQLPA